MRTTWTSRARASAAASCSLVLLLAACGGGDGDDAQIATLSDGAVTSDTDASTGATSVEDSEDALLEYAQCMRDNGVDMADPTFDADGDAAGGGFGPGSGIDPRSEGFRAAQDACGSLIEGVTLGRGPGGGGFDVEAVQEASLAFTSCLRDEGLDVGDLDLAQPGRGGPPDGAAPPDGGGGGAPGAGAARGPGGDPSGRLVELLGLDADDPAVVAALEVCQPLMEQAFTAPGATTATTTEQG